MSDHIFGYSRAEGYDHSIQARIWILFDRSNSCLKRTKATVRTLLYCFKIALVKVGAISVLWLVKRDKKRLCDVRFYRKTMYFLFTLSNSCSLVVLFLQYKLVIHFITSLYWKKKEQCQSVEIMNCNLRQTREILWNNCLMVWYYKLPPFKNGSELQNHYSFVVRLQGKAGPPRPEFHDDRQKLRQIRKQNVKLLKLISLRLVNNQNMVNIHRIWDLG